MTTIKFEESESFSGLFIIKENRDKAKKGGKYVSAGQGGKCISADACKHMVFHLK
jgi:hypothetical protein